MSVITRPAAYIFGLVLSLALTSHAPAQQSQIWPQRTVRLIVPLPPGSGTDIAARVLAEHLSQRWSQPVIVENRQGADGIPAVTSFLATRDTHTLLFSFAGIMTINPLIHEQLPYDPKDLIPIAPVAENFFGISASAMLKAETLADLVKIAKAHPGKLNWAATPGVPSYVLRALMTSAAIDMVQVAYRDFGPALQDLTQGRLELAATAMQLLLPHHRAGTTKLMFVTSRERSPQAPEIPTAAEEGYPSLTLEAVVGVYGWRSMPTDVQERISTEVQAVTADPAFRTRITASGSAPRNGTASQFAAAIEEQRARIAAIHQATSKPVN